MRTSLHTSRRSSTPCSLHLFGHDLRLADNAGLVEAARLGDIVPALVVDPETEDAFARNPRRAAYYCGAVSSLARDLASRDSRLICRRGPLVPSVVRLARESEADTVTWAIAYDSATLARQRAVQAALEEVGVRVVAVHDAPAVPPEETAAARTDGDGRGYRAFAPYVTAWSAQAREVRAGRLTFGASTLASDPLPASAAGGAASTLELPSEARVRADFETYLAGPILQYFTARDVPGGEPTARLSAPLSFGLISARTVLARVDERSRDPFLLTEERLSLAAFSRALAQRDFFLQLAWFFEHTPDLALQARMRAFPFASGHPALEAWRHGLTGYPLVDAGMRQLRETGWMHPHVRQVAASFLCFDLGVDWRVGRDAWDAFLVEDDAALANGNWQWIAGVGADLAQFPRIYNPRKQARSFDPLGNYARLYIPELAYAPEAEFTGSRAGPHGQLRLELFEDVRYPAPVVDHDTAAGAFLARYAAFTQVSALTP